MPERPIGVELVPFLSSRHRPLLRAWLRRAHVSPWWGDTKDALANVDGHPPDMHATIVVGGEPVGYVCWQGLSAEELAAAGLGALPPDHVDVDILIGEVELLGRGIGPRVLHMVIERLRSLGVSSVGLATAVDNRRARRGFEKAGFRPFGAFEEEGKRFVYMTTPSEEGQDSGDMDQKEGARP